MLDDPGRGAYGVHAVYSSIVIVAPYLIEIAVTIKKCLLRRRYVVVFRAEHDDWRANIGESPAIVVAEVLSVG